jgi:hypothetical protein
MINLAGHELADVYCELELRRAGIDVLIGEDAKGEVRTRVTGKLGPFTFRRAWYYWIVEGPMPMPVAVQLYLDPVGVQDVRVEGHCVCPDPREYCKHQSTVDSYHIDSQAGLDLFARTVRKYGLDKVTA